MVGDSEIRIGRDRSRLRVGLTLATTLSMAFVVAYVSTSWTPAEHPSRGTGMAPSDGLRQTRHISSSNGDRATWVVEHAIDRGPTSLLPPDSSVRSRVLPAAGSDEARDMVLWRQISTVAEPRQAEPATDQDQEVIVRSLTDRGIEQLMEYGGGSVWAFKPGLIEVPADVHPGQTWTQSGKAGARLDIDYTSSGTAATAADAAQARRGCLSIVGRLVQTDPSSGESQATETRSTWCPGQGEVARTSERSGASISWTSDAALPPPPPGLSLTAPLAWSTPASWELHEVPASRHVDGFDAEILATSFMAPLVVGADLLVAPVTTGNDLVALHRTEDGAAWHVLWRAHPGGRILAASSVGDVSLTWTVDRRVVAYDPRGRRLWDRTGDDVLAAAPVAMAGGGLVLTWADGRVDLLDTVTGSLRWSHRPGAEINQAAAVSDKGVAVVDRLHHVTMLDGPTGATLWEDDASVSGVLAASGSTVVLPDDDGLRGVDATTGALRWRGPRLSTYLRPQNVGGLIIFPTADKTVAVDATTGAARWETQPFHHVLSDGTHVVAVDGADMVLLDPGGRTVRRWPDPVARGAGSSSSAGISAAPQGLLITTSRLDAVWELR
jgi:outer membrane protein assembly factor BamB